MKRPQQQQQPNKSRRTLQRVLTEEKEAATKRKHPSLVRSSTAPSAHDLKRGESREPSLPPLHGSVRGGIQVPRRVEAREVDLEAAAKQQEARLKKINAMMAQKKELEAAIEALRKAEPRAVRKGDGGFRGEEGQRQHQREEGQKSYAQRLQSGRTGDGDPERVEDEGCSGRARAARVAVLEAAWPGTRHIPEQ